MTDSYNKIFANKSKVMFVFAHPDDAEICSGGLIAKLVKDNKKVLLVKMTMGNKGSRDGDISEIDLAKTRETEDAVALEVLGLSPADSVNLNLGDGEVENSLMTIGKIVEQIRKFKPELVVTHNPETALIRDLNGEYYFNHRDHRNTAVSVIDAIHPYSRDKLFYPEQLQAGLSCHTTTELLLVDSWGHQDTVYFDVTDFVGQKEKSIASHVSQYDEERAKGLAEFMLQVENGQSYEQYRYVAAE